MFNPFSPIFSRNNPLKGGLLSQKSDDTSLGPIPEKELLLENGSNILLEDGGKILLEDGT